VLRPQTLGEEIANSVSHGIGLLAAIVGLPVLIVSAVRHGTASTVVGATIFGATMIILYLASTLYHAMPRNRAKRLFRVFDHGAIFLVIAGTYTPFTLGVLRGGWGWSLFGIVWGLAIFGILLKSVNGVRNMVLSTIVYLAMGWVVVIAVGPLVERMPVPGLWLLFAGGLSYTAGVIFFAVPKVPYSHFVWHLFVLAGSAFHFFAVLRYAA
jgi:hemolysin III